MSAERVIEIARGELGYTESPPGSNRTKYGEAFGWNGVPWCVMFLWWCFREAGEGKAFFGGAKTASCGTLLRWYQEQGLTVPVSEVRPGDVVILNFSGTKETQHCGYVVDLTVTWDSSGNVNDPDSFFRVSAIKTIEGNTSIAGSQSNGGMVCEKTRYPSQVVAVARPKYKKEVEPVDDIKGRWSEAAIRRCINRGIVKGYPDGSFKPEKPLTREEACVMLDRLVQIFVGEDGK